MTLSKKIAQNTSVQLIGKTVSTLLGLLAVAIMTRALGAAQFGWYATAVGFLQFVGIFSDFGFTVTTANLLAEPKFEKNKLLNTIFTWRIITAFFFQGLAPLLFLFFPYPAPIKTAVFILSISFFAQALIQVFVGYLQTQLKMHWQAVGEILGRVVLVGGLALVARFGFGYLPMMWVITAAAVVYAAYMYWRSRPLGFCLDREITRALFKKMWPTALAVLFNAIYLQGDRVILPLYATATEVGFYSAAYRVLDIITQVAAMVMGLLMPLMTFAWSRNLKEEFSVHFQRAFDLTALFLLPMVAGAIFLATPIMRFVAGAEFSGAGRILQILSLAIIGICFGMVFGHASLAIGRQKQALWVYITDAVISFIAYLVFIPKFGPWGAAGVTIFSEFYAGFGLAMVAGYWSNFIPRLKNFYKILFSSLFMGGVIYYLKLHLLFSILIGALIYGLLILALRVISKQTLQEIFKRSV